MNGPDEGRTRVLLLRVSDALATEPHRQFIYIYGNKITMHYEHYK